MKTQTIGVEIEMTGLTREAVANAVAEYFGTTAKYVGGMYRAYEVKDNSGRIWKLMRDSSIEAQRKTTDGKIRYEGDDYQVELVTPILKYEDIETLQEVVRSVKAAGAFVNKSCGLHVHIGAKDFTAKQLRNLLKYVASREEIFYAALNVHRNRKDYCRPADKRIIEEVNKKKPDTLEKFKEIWYNGEPSRANYHYDNSRYTVLNLHSFFSKGTVEFRIFNSTLHAGEVKAYVQFCLAITHSAKVTGYSVYKPLTDRFAERMEKILVGNELTGEEFKTCRYHLMKHLRNKLSEAEEVA